MPPETTAIEEQAKIYERSINDLKRSHQEALEIHLVRHRDLEQRAKEQATELKAQADGLLGALGRINAENADLRAQLDHAKVRLLEADVKITRISEQRDLCENQFAAAMEEANEKMRDLKAELAKATGKK